MSGSPDPMAVGGERRHNVVPWQLAGLVLGNSPQERVIPGLQVTVIGMGVVFAVLILLYFILTLVGRFGAQQAGEPSTGSGTPAAPAMVQPAQALQAPVVSAATAQPEAPSQVATAADDRSAEQLTAVIAAAIAAATANGNPAPHQVKRRQSAQLGWAMAGRIALHTARETLPRG